MAGLAALLLKPALDAALASTAAKGTMDMNKKEETKPILDDGLLSKSEKKTEEKVKEPEYKTLSKDEIDDLMIMLAEGGLSGPEAKKIAETGYISEKALKKLSPDAIRNIEGLTGVSMAFPEGDKPEGTPPVTGTTVKKTTRTETPDGEVKETTTTFDGNSGVEKSSKTEIPEVDWSELFPDIDLAAIPPEKITPNHPLVRKAAKEHGLSPELVARELRKNLRTQESLRGGIVETKTQAKKAFDQANAIHGRTVEVEPEDIMPSHMSKAEQNQERHAGQERLARQILKNEAKAKNNLLHKDE